MYLIGQMLVQQEKQHRESLQGNDFSFTNRNYLFKKKIFSTHQLERLDEAGFGLTDLGYHFLSIQNIYLHKLVLLYEL